MIHIVINRAENGCIKGFTSKGHAGYADKGEDIVCAAVSMLVINTLNSIERLSPEDLPLMQVSSDEKGGEIRCKFSDIPSEKALLLLDSMYYGLKDSVKNYGSKYIELTEETV
ncbi:MAG: ribosomal-processing cysteine protease Prp [Lachnospiraceae bacterium]|nr:ribosomal-processing cysteine protease Prp [Lachnospiraceae bacterium]